jgi:hypothetical protein
MSEFMEDLQQRYPEMKPISSAPTMFSVNGIGTPPGRPVDGTASTKHCSFNFEEVLHNEAEEEGPGSGSASRQGSQGRLADPEDLVAKNPYFEIMGFVKRIRF